MSTEEENTVDGQILSMSSSTLMPNRVSQADLMAQMYPSVHKAVKEAAEKCLQHPAIRSRVTSSIWEIDNFNPPQLFSADQSKCVILTVTVLNGTNITNGKLHDIVDTPDPYVTLRLTGTPNRYKKTKCISDSKFPVWNKQFKFLLPEDTSDREFCLLVGLSEYDDLIDDKIGTYKVDLNHLDLVYGEEQFLRANFENGSVVNLSIRKDLDSSGPDLRYNLALCDDEKQFLQQRRERVYMAMRKLLGDENGPMTSKEVPVIGLLGSGGGFRAMVGLSGVFSALHDLGILDCVAYAAGLSGSTWYLSFLYSHPDFPEKAPSSFKEELREVVNQRWLWILTKGAVGYLWQLREKAKSGQPVSLTDLFGHIIGDTILKDRKYLLLSSQKEVLADGKVPMPLYTCLNVLNNVQANVYQDWVEFSPYEIGIPKYGTFMKTQDFGNKFYVGKIIRRFPEVPLHFLQGVWGSGFCILIKRFFTSWGDLEKTVSTFDSGRKDCEIEIDGFVNESELFADDSDSEYSTDSDETDEVFDDDEEGIQLDTARVVNKEKKRKGSFFGFFKRILKSLLADSKLLDRRKSRAGLVFNPLRGLKPQATIPVSPVSPPTPQDTRDFKGFYYHTEYSAKKMLMVDAGLNFNIPFPALLRPQRGVELYLSFDFTHRDKDDAPPFEELKCSEQWAKLNQLPFPPIMHLAEFYEKEEMREFYVFEDLQDPNCPTILHFVLCNKQFRHFKAPDVPRENKSEDKYADFSIFEDPSDPYSTTNFHYTSEQFNRLHDLMEFNVRLASEEIKMQIKAAIDRKKKLQSQTSSTEEFSAGGSIGREREEEEIPSVFKLDPIKKILPGVKGTKLPSKKNNETAEK
ncbi:cytosolic phospholipase A2-like [Neocloeon triangulifer]|uniref:cytosolic phospholipase A2-like n=1 Tax=Neocloeon triangulifer TaxID=2078957 RepID=UPI00286F18BF|nr:cytosolic phospholipase A2-like [Neocloeon triangulifer]